VGVWQSFKVLKFQSFIVSNTPFQRFLRLCRSRGTVMFEMARRRVVSTQAEQRAAKTAPDQGGFFMCWEIA
jgi:hypothetical protein